MKKLIIFCLFLTACQTPVQKESQLSAFRACRSYGPGTQAFEKCMKECKERGKWNADQGKRALMYQQGGTDVVRERESEIDLDRTPAKKSITFPTSLFSGN
ncbi:MAG: hypothetical protein H0X26_00565 [Alphaproteobacteria bacterium]|nr:hypothetical protein [Alphaproteobacteria bacterium]